MKNIKNDKILSAFITEVKSLFKGNLKKILLYGSRARGDYSPESDYDCILIFSRLTSDIRQQIDAIEDAILAQHYVLFSTILITEEILKNRQYEPFLINAQKEGILL